MSMRSGEKEARGLTELLTRYCAGDTLPMHMPGHKRNADMAGYLDALGARLDITEVSGMDNLHDAHGVLKDAMDRAAALWGGDRAWFLVNGGTCGVLAGIAAATRRGDTVLVGRNCHLCVYRALDLLGLKPVFFLPDFLDAPGVFRGARDVEPLLAAHPDCRLVVLTSPTYEGFVSDVAGICRAAHARNIPVLVDAAHGPHLAFSPAFPPCAVAQGADLTVHSLHKTLPALTQTALLHLRGRLADPARVEEALAVFETSSPSYLLMASIDGCVGLIQSRGKALFERWTNMLGEFYRRTARLERLRVADFPDKDPAKLVIGTYETGMTGGALFERLRDEFHIEAELRAPAHVVAMTGLGEREGSLDRLADALEAIDRKSPPGRLVCPAPLPLPQMARARGEARALPLDRCLGRVSAQYAWAYPPGVPILIPGELVGEAQIRAVRERLALGELRVYCPGNP